MGTLHRAIVAVRSPVVGLDDGSLPAFASGEQRTIETYDEAIGCETDERSMETLEGRRDALYLKVAR